MSSTQSKSVQKREKRKAFSALLGALARRGDGSETFRGEPKRIMVLVSERFGDTILLTPLFRSLRERYPDAVIHALTFRRSIESFLQNDPNFDQVFYAKGEYGRYIRGVLSRRYDVLFNPKDSVSTNFLLQSFLIRARFKVAHAHTYHEGLFDHLIRLEYLTHFSYRACALLDVLASRESGTEACGRPYMPVMDASQEIKAFAASLQGRRVIGINISAGNAVRYWQNEKWIELVQRFPGEQFILFSAPKDLERKLAIARECSNVMETPSTANMYEAALLLQPLRLLVTPDTSFIHMAACYNIPVVGLYRDRIHARKRFSPLSAISRMVVSPSGSVGDIPLRKVDEAFRDVLERSV